MVEQQTQKWSIAESDVWIMQQITIGKQPKEICKNPNYVRARLRTLKANGIDFPNKYQWFASARERSIIYALQNTQFRTLQELAKTVRTSYPGLLASMCRMRRKGILPNIPRTQSERDGLTEAERETLNISRQNGRLTKHQMAELLNISSENAKTRVARLNKKGYEIHFIPKRREVILPNNEINPYYVCLMQRITIGRKPGDIVREFSDLYSPHEITNAILRVRRAGIDFPLWERDWFAGRAGRSIIYHSSHRLQTAKEIAQKTGSWVQTVLRYKEQLSQQGILIPLKES